MWHHRKDLLPVSHHQYGEVPKQLVALPHIFQVSIQALIHPLMAHEHLIDDDQVSLLHEFSCGILFGKVADRFSLVDRNFIASMEGMSIVQ